MLYDHIIVPFDGTARSRDAVNAAADLTARLAARLLVLSSGDVGHAGELAALKQRAMEMSDERVDFWVDAQRRVADAVAASVQHRPTSLVAMCTHARTGVDKALFGSVAEKVLRATDVPVLLFGPQWTAVDNFTVTEVVAAVDLSPLSDEVLPLAATWAQGLGVPCTLVHVPGRGRRHRHDEHDDRDALLERLGAASADLRPYVGPVGVEVLEAGDPASRLVERAVASPGAVVVMATHNRAGLDRMTTGSVTIDVVHHCPRPVLVSRGGLRSLGTVG